MRKLFLALPLMPIGYEFGYHNGFRTCFMPVPRMWGKQHKPHRLTSAQRYHRAVNRK